MEGGLLTKLLHPSVEFPDHLSTSRKNDPYLLLKNHTSLVLFNLSLHLLVKRYNDTGLEIDLSGFSKYHIAIAKIAPKTDKFTKSKP